MVELVIVLVIIGLVSLVAIREFRLYLDRLAVRNAVGDAAQVIAQARDEALARHVVVSVRIDTAAATLALRARGLPPAFHALGHAHGVSLASARDSVAFDARGLGIGAANFTLVVRRGRAADSLIVSRLGRARF